MTHFCATHAHEVPLPQMLPLGSTSGSNFVSRVIIRLTEALGTRLMGYLLSELFTSTHACYPYQWAISWAMCECVNTQYMWENNSTFDDTCWLFLMGKQLLSWRIGVSYAPIVPPFRETWIRKLRMHGYKHEVIWKETVNPFNNALSLVWLCALQQIYLMCMRLWRYVDEENESFSNTCTTHF